MQGRPDYGVGDLVVCVDDRPCGVTGDMLPVKRGQVLQVDDLFEDLDPASFEEMWFARFRASRADITAARFRRLDPHPPEFFAGHMDADAGEGVTV